MTKLFGLALSFLFWSCAQGPHEVSKIEGDLVTISDSLVKDESLEVFISPYRTRITEEMEGVLAYTPKAMTKSDFKLNTPIGNMMADAVMEMASPIFEKRTGNTIDLVILNYGGIRSGINAGNISTRTAFDIMPFENEVAVAELTSDELNTLVDYLVQNKVAHPIAGLQVILDAEGELKKAKVNGEQISLLDSNEKTHNRPYYVATSDYLVKGGDQMSFFLNSKAIYALDYKLRNIFIDYFQKKDTITPKRDQRFIQLQN